MPWCDRLQMVQLGTVKRTETNFSEINPSKFFLSSAKLNKGEDARYSMLQCTIQQKKTFTLGPYNVKQSREHGANRIIIEITASAEGCERRGYQYFGGYGDLSQIYDFFSPLYGKN